MTCVSPFLLNVLNPEVTHILMVGQGATASLAACREGSRTSHEGIVGDFSMVCQSATKYWCGTIPSRKVRTAGRSASRKFLERLAKPAMSVSRSHSRRR